MWGSTGDGDKVRRRNGSHSDLPGENMLEGLGLVMKVGWGGKIRGVHAPSKEMKEEIDGIFNIRLDGKLDLCSSWGFQLAVCVFAWMVWLCVTTDGCMPRRKERNVITGWAVEREARVD
jgi:hypothetical protein